MQYGPYMTVASSMKLRLVIYQYTYTILNITVMCTGMSRKEVPYYVLHRPYVKVASPTKGLFLYIIIYIYITFMCTEIILHTYYSVQ